MGKSGSFGLAMGKHPVGTFWAPAVPLLSLRDDSRSCADLLSYLDFWGPKTGWFLILRS